MSQVTNSETDFTGNVITTPMLETSCNTIKLNEETFEKGPETIQCYLYVFKHNETFLTMKCFESCMYAST